MMNNLFSIFDPSTSFLLSSNWLSLFIIFLFIPSNYYYLNSRISWIKMTALTAITAELKSNLKKVNYKNLFFFMGFFYIIAISNFLSLFPFIFTPTSHISVSFSLAFPFWFSLLIKGWSLNTMNSLIHLVPLNTPLLLCPLMVIIETISSLIRPLTLSIRLSANMIAGHLLISLMSGLLDINLFIFPIISILLNTLIVLEMAVSLIQGYVFIILMSLYLNEL